MCWTRFTVSYGTWQFIVNICLLSLRGPKKLSILKHPATFVNAVFRDLLNEPQITTVWSNACFGKNTFLWWNIPRHTRIQTLQAVSKVGTLPLGNHTWIQIPQKTMTSAVQVPLTNLALNCTTLLAWSHRRMGKFWVFSAENIFNQLTKSYRQEKHYT